MKKSRDLIIPIWGQGCEQLIWCIQISKREVQKAMTTWFALGNQDREASRLWGISSVHTQWRRHSQTDAGPGRSCEAEHSLCMCSVPGLSTRSQEEGKWSSLIIFFCFFSKNFIEFLCISCNSSQSNLDPSPIHTTVPPPDFMLSDIYVKSYPIKHL